jgi:hypothetical protein
MAEFGFTPQEISVNAEIPEDVFLEQLAIPGSDIYNAFKTGVNTGEIKVRTSIMKSASQGSHPAQMQMLKFFEDSKVLAKIYE